MDHRREHEAWFSAVCIFAALSGAAVVLLFRRFEALTILLADATPMSRLTLGMALACAVSLLRPTVRAAASQLGAAG